MTVRSSRYAIVLAVLSACGGAVAPHDEKTEQATGSSVSDAGASSCAAVGTQCQAFEPGGPSRWGCNTTGPQPELACEHAAGADIARCNCQGNFGECTPGQACPFVWFDEPATSTFFTDEEMRRIWRDVCGGVCTE